jgi:hypothetical protein
MKQEQNNYFSKMTSILSPDTDYYGYYLFQNLKFNNKYDLMLLTNDPRDVSWHYHDDFFSSFDWKQEPSVSLEACYIDKALELRHRFDYIILMYGGGADSGNILETFVRNNIYLDEVCCLTNMNGSRNQNSFHNFEVFNVGKPKIENLIEQYKLKTKIRLLDITEQTLKFYNKNTQLDFIHWINNYGSAYCQAKGELENLVPEWQRITESGKRVCLLWGGEKPKLTIKNGKFFFYFLDVIDGIFSLRPQQTSNHNSISNELFYWGPTSASAKIIIKQAHIIKNFLSNNDNIRNSLKNQSIKDENAFVLWQGRKLLEIDNFKTLIYPYWDISNRLITKSITGNFLSSRDSWFWTKGNEPQVKIFLDGLKYLSNTIQPNWIEDYFSYQNVLYPKSIFKIRSKLYEL